MENEDPIAADHRVDVIYERAPARDRTAKNTMTAARGGVQSKRSFENETAPLLRSSSNDDDGRGDSNGAHDTAQEDWPEDEFSQLEKLPWHRRPSVNGAQRSQWSLYTNIR